MRKLYDAADRFCARHPRFGVPDLMRYIVIGNVVVFFLIMLIWTLASYLLDLAFRFPVLSGLNRLGGAAFGLIKGVVIVFLLVWLLRRFAMLPLPEELAQTKLLYFFANTNPLTLFLP